MELHVLTKGEHLTGVEEGAASFLLGNLFLMHKIVFQKENIPYFVVLTHPHCTKHFWTKPTKHSLDAIILYLHVQHLSNVGTGLQEILTDKNNPTKSILSK